GTVAITVDSGVRLVSPAGAMSWLHTPEGLINSARGVTVDAAGRLVVTDAYTNRVFRVGMDGSLVPSAGTGAKGFGGDRGSALAARLNAPADVAATPDGGFLIADSGNGRAREADSHGRIPTIAGGGTVGPAPD